MKVVTSVAWFLAVAAIAQAIPTLDEAVSYVFLQRFPLTGGLFYHTEVLVCAQDAFSGNDRHYIDKVLTSTTDFTEMPTSWWTKRSTVCVELGYGGAACSEECCGVPHEADQKAYPLNSRTAVISNIEVDKKKVYLYGDGNLDGEEAYHHVCDHKCWSNWSGTDYNPLTNNCNTFTSTVLSCVFGLSEKKPNLGPSDLVPVQCKCADDAISEK